MTLEHLSDIRRKIADLAELAQILEDMAAQCEGGAVPECPIVDALFQRRGLTPCLLQGEPHTID